ncbi:MAG: GGDEF domain-containing protein [Candidatus Thermochlorobacter sp.]
MTLRSKIFFLLLFVMLISGAFPVISLYMLNRFEIDFKRYVTAQSNDFIALKEVKIHLLIYDSGLWKFVATGDRSLFSKMKPLEASIERDLKDLLKNSGSDSLTRSRLHNVQAAVQQYFADVAEISKSQSEVRRLALNQQQKIDQILRDINVLLERTQDDLVGASAQLGEKLSTLTLVAIGMAIVFFLILTPMAYMIYRSTAVPIRNICSQLGSVRVDDPQTIVRMISDMRTMSTSRRFNDEIAMLGRKISEFGTAINEKNEELSRLIITDEKTQLFNFRYFKSQLHQEFVRARRFQEPFSIIMVDVDKFKHYNDTNGHLLGDEVLKKVARLIRQECRETDIPARFGGEEFAVLLPRTDKDEAKAVAERIRKAIEDEVFINQEKQPGGNLTASLGIATFPHDATSEEELISVADIALYEAKARGRNRSLHYSDLQLTQTG